ncbi:hypothetical protein STANM309S_01324 [Streptomyces tanashiensis]
MDGDDEGEGAEREEGAGGVVEQVDAVPHGRDPRDRPDEHHRSDAPLHNSIPIRRTSGMTRNVLISAVVNAWSAEYRARPRASRPAWPAERQIEGVGQDQMRQGDPERGDDQRLQEAGARGVGADGAMRPDYTRGVYTARSGPSVAREHRPPPTPHSPRRRARPRHRPASRSTPRPPPRVVERGEEHPVGVLDPAGEGPLPRQAPAAGRAGEPAGRGHDRRRDAHVGRVAPQVALPLGRQVGGEAAVSSEQHRAPGGGGTGRADPGDRVEQFGEAAGRAAPAAGHEVPGEAGGGHRPEDLGVEPAGPLPPPRRAARRRPGGGRRRGGRGRRRRVMTRTPCVEVQWWY